MGPIPERQVRRAGCQDAIPAPTALPLDIGNPDVIGISDLGRFDNGDPVEILAQDQNVARHVLEKLPQIVRPGVLGIRLDHHQTAIELDNPLPQRGRVSRYDFGLKSQAMPFEEPPNPRREILRTGEIGSPGNRQSAAAAAGDLSSDVERPR